MEAFLQKLPELRITFGNAVLESNAGVFVKDLVGNLLHFGDWEGLHGRVSCGKRDDIRVAVF